MESLSLDFGLAPRRSPLQRLLSRGWKTSLPAFTMAIAGLLYGWLLTSELLRGIGITTPLLLLLVATIVRRPGPLRAWEVIARRILLLTAFFFASHVLLIPLFQILLVALVALSWFILRPVGVSR